MTWGDREGRDPNLLFSVAYYKAKAGISADDNALLHYLNTYGLAGDPHLLFDTRFYLSSLGHDLSSVTTPLAYYLTDPTGMKVSPFPLFDPNHLRAQSGGVIPDGTPPLLYYLRQPAETALSPHPLFDPAFFHETVGYGEPGLVEYASTLQNLGRDGYHPHRMHYHEANPDFCSVSYLLDHPQLMETAEIPMVHYARFVDGALYAKGSRAEPYAPDAEDFRDHYRPANYSADRLLNAIQEQIFQDVKYLSRNDILILEASERDVSLRTLFNAAHAHTTIVGDDPELIGKIAKKRRLCLYAVYLPDGQLKSYHKAMLSALREAGYPTILINSMIGGAVRLALDATGLAAAIMVREGDGRDFASWVTAIAHFAAALQEVDHLLLLNDSLVGPFGELGKLLKALEVDSADFKGLTESFDRAHHLQSSLLLLSRDALFSRGFLNFLLNFIIPPAGGTITRGDARRASARQAIARAGEIYLSKQLISSGVAYSAKTPYAAATRAWLARIPDQVRWAHDLPERFTEIGLNWFFPKDVAARFSRYMDEWLFDRAARLRVGERANPQHMFWDSLLVGGDFPFIKKDLLLMNPLHVPTIVRLCDIFPTDRQAEYAKLLEDLVPPQTGLPPSYFRLSQSLLEGMLNKRK
jgi:hypothetical protein